MTHYHLQPTLLQDTVLESFAAANPLSHRNATEIGSSSKSCKHHQTTMPFGDKAYATATATDLDGDKMLKSCLTTLLTMVFTTDKYPTKAAQPFMLTRF